MDHTKPTNQPGGPEKPKTRKKREYPPTIPVVDLKTRIPMMVWKFAGQIAKTEDQYLSILPESVRAEMTNRRASDTLFFEAALRYFLAARPWADRQFIWYQPHTATTRAGGVDSKTDWVQVNMRVPTELAERIWRSSTDEKEIRSRIPAGGLCKELDVTLSAVLWTGVKWFIERLAEHQARLAPIPPPINLPG